MVLVNLMPGNTGCSGALTANKRSKGSPHKCCLLSSRNSISREQEQRHTYCTLRRKWLLGRSKSEEASRSNSKAFQRRLSFPLAKGRREIAEEMTTPVKAWWRVSNTTSENSSNQRSIFLKFWRGDDDDDFHNALENIDITSAEDVNRLIESVRRHINQKPVSATDLAEVVQDVYRTIEVQLREKVLFHHITPERSYMMMADFEEVFIRSFHNEIFHRIAIEEEESDRYLSSKIEDLYWIRARHLAASIEETNISVLDCLDKAMLALATINFRESATEKVECVMECSKRIFDSLKNHGDLGGADEFLPVLIYVVLQSNPAHLHSNVRYMLQFSNTDRIMKGEEGYYFTHLCSVVSYIENLTAESLDMDKAKFEQNCEHFRDGDAESPDLSERNGPNYRRLSRYICDLYHRAAEEQVFKERQEALWTKAAALQKKLDDMKKS